jgi:hypothetical protein
VRVEVLRIGSDSEYEVSASSGLTRDSDWPLRVDGAA